MYQQKIRQQAVELREQGYSYNYIQKFVPVSKSTLSEWLQNVPFTPNKHTIQTIGSARIASGIYKHRIKVENFDKALIQSKKDIGSLSNRDIMMLGLGIYIGEGGKTMGMTRIINSDARIIKFALRWIKISFGIGIENVKIRLYLYPDSNEKDSIKYWSKQTGVPVNQFFKSTIDRRTDKKLSNKGKLPHGTAHMSVKSLGNKDFGVYLHRRIMAWIDLVLC